jgi:hypothetical protein
MLLCTFRRCREFRRSERKYDEAPGELHLQESSAMLHGSCGLASRSGVVSVLSFAEESASRSKLGARLLAISCNPADAM